MRIILITLSTPTYNNVRGASALPYHLIMGARETEKVDFEVYSYNINNIDVAGIAEVERALKVKIHLLNRPWWMIWMFQLHLGVLRILLKYPYLAYLRLSRQVVEEIRRKQPDMIWIYGEEIAFQTKHFKGFGCVVTMPDCESMYYHRLLTKGFATRSLYQIFRYAFAYWQYRSMERNSFQEDVTYHFVGEADAEFYKTINLNANAFFLHHPLYAYDASKKIRFCNPKIKLLFAGRYDFYCRHGSDELLNAIIKHKKVLQPFYEITFLGKGWEDWNNKLKLEGFSSFHVKFAPNYIAELQKHDIQVNAIDVGTGTKGKVLDALANGLLVIGTPYALENIAVENGKSCIAYHEIRQAIEVLLDIPEHVSRYEQMAENGRQQVLAEHAREKCARDLFSLMD